MARVRCYECNKTYDYYEDGFCPRCGCFNQPPRASRIDAAGNIVYHEGINEKAHSGSFVHKEYHTENRKRAFTKLEAKVPKVQIHIPKEFSGKGGKQMDEKAMVKLVMGGIYALFLLIFFFAQL